MKNPIIILITILVFAFQANAQIQSDTSDAYWSVVIPLLTSKNIDMGEETVNETKYLVETTFLENHSGYPIVVDTIYFSDPVQFGLTKGMPPYTVPDGGMKTVEFTFTPSSIGRKNATIVIITQSDTIRQSITGVGVQKQLDIITSIVNFGRVEIGDTKNMSEFVIENVGSIPVIIDSTRFMIKDGCQFGIVTNGQFTILSGEKKEMEFQFKPIMVGRTSRDVAFYYNGVGSPALVKLYGEGMGGLVYIANDSAKQGEKVNLRLMLGGAAKINSFQDVADKFRVKLRVQKSILTLNENRSNFKKSLSNDSIIIDITAPLTNTGNLLIEIPMIAGLGSVKETAVDILDFAWLDENNNVIDYDTEYQSGVFKLLGVCPEGGDRLLNPEGEVQLMSIKPNPADKTFEVEVELTEKGYTQLYITNLSGKKVLTLFEGESHLGVNKFTYNTDGLESGQYYIVLQTPTIIKSQKLKVVK
jgi:hypothetical protein